MTGEENPKIPAEGAISRAGSGLLLLLMVLVVPMIGVVIAHLLFSASLAVLATISVACLLCGAFSIAISSPWVVRPALKEMQEELVIFIIGWSIGATTLVLLALHVAWAPRP